MRLRLVNPAPVAIPPPPGHPLGGKMKWMPNSSRNSLRSLMKSALRFMRRASLSLLVSVGLSAFFSPVVSSADDDFNDSSYFDLADSSDSRVVSLMLEGLRASGQSSGNITNDVAAILDLLNSFTTAQFSSSYGTRRIINVPLAFAQYNYPLASLLNRLFSDVPGSNAVFPNQGNSYLFQIRNLLASLTNRNDSIDIGSVTNLLASINRFQSAISFHTNALYAGNGASVGYNLGNISDFLLYDFAPVAGNLGDFLESSPNGWDDFFGMVYLASQDTDQAFIPGQRAFRVSDTNSQALLSDIVSALDDLSSSVDDVGDLVGTGLGIDQNGSSISDSLATIEKDLTDMEWILDSIEDYTYFIHYYDLDYAQTSRSVQKDFESVISLLAGVSNEVSSPLNNDYNASRAVSSFESTNAALQHALAEQVSETSNTMASASSSDPDFGTGSVGNPYNPIGDAIAAFQTDVERKLPDYQGVSGSEVIEIFKADSGLPMDAAGVVRVNLREEMGSWVNTCGNVMSWFWNIVNSVLTIVLVARAFREIGNSI